MAKYTWNIEVIKERLNTLKRMLETENNSKKRKLLKYDITGLEIYLDDFYDTEPQEQVKLLEGYRMIKSDLEKVSFVWSDIKEFKEITETPLIHIPELKNSSLSKDDILELTHDFYKTLNHYFYGQFMKNFYRRYDHIAFRKPLSNGDKGHTISFLTRNEAFINVFRYNNLDDVLTTIHEYMHATSNCINHFHLSPPKNLYMEIDSIFMELIAAEFLENIFKNGQPTLIRAYEHGRYACTADELEAKISLIEFEKTQGKKLINNKAIKQAGKNHCQMLSEEIDDLLTKPNFSGKDYLVSYMFAIELYKIYLEDKEKALYYLKKIIMLNCRTSEEYYSNIKRFGIIPNLSAQQIHKQFTDEAIKLTRKKSKH